MLDWPLLRMLPEGLCKLSPLLLDLMDERPLGPSHPPNRISVPAMSLFMLCVRFETESAFSVK